MEEKAMRKLDRREGVLLCFLLTGFEFLRKKLARKRNYSSLPRRILFIELSELGSIILASPAISLIKKKYPQAELFFLTFKDKREVVLFLSAFPERNVFTIRNDNLFIFLLDTLRCILALKREKIDTIIDLELFLRFTSIISYLIYAEKRIGFHSYNIKGLYRGNLYSHKVAYNHYQHISYNYINLVQALYVPYSEQGILLRKKQYKAPLLLQAKDYYNKNILLKLSPRLVSLLENGGQLIIMNFGSEDSIGVRVWPLDKYFSLAVRLLEEENNTVVAVGKGNYAADMFQHPRFFNFIDKTSIRDLLALFSIANVFVSHDGGLVHLASCTKVYIVVLFGPETPVLYSPLTKNVKVIYKDFSCSPCLSAYNYRVSQCRNNLCLKTI